MFLYAKLVLEHLIDLSSMAELKQELQPGIFPASLEEALVIHSFHIITAFLVTRRSSQKIYLTCIICQIQKIGTSLTEGLLKGQKQVESSDQNFELCGLLQADPLLEGNTVSLLYRSVNWRSRLRSPSCQELQAALWLFPGLAHY